MRHVMALLLMAGCASVATSASQARAGAAVGTRISACALLTPDVMETFDTATLQSRKSSAPEEESIGAHGTYHAELMVWTGPHHFTVQLGVPAGATVESIKPKAIGLAAAVVQKLR